METDLRDLVLFGTSAHPDLMEDIARILGIEHGRYASPPFPNYNSLPQLQTNVTDCHVFVLHSFTPTEKVEADWAEAKKLIFAVKEYGAREVILILGYFSYARSHREAPKGVPLAANLYAAEAKLAGADKIIVVVLHDTDCIKSFGVPVIHLDTKTQIIENLKPFIEEGKTTLLSADEGRKERIKAFAKDMKLPLAWGVKIRKSDTVVEIVDIQGEPLLEIVILIDDELNTGGTIESLSLYVLKNHPHVKKIVDAFTHGLICGPAFNRLAGITKAAEERSVDLNLIFTDSLPILANKRLPNMKIISIAPMLANIIQAIHLGQEIDPKYLY